MNHFGINILGFAACAGVIIYSGTKLSFYGDRIAGLTRLGGAWVGLILMASVTSLPELVTGISSVAIVNAPDLAGGDIFGSCAFNLLILSVLDARIKKPLSSTENSSQVVAAIFGIILLTAACMAIFLSHEIPSVFWTSSFTFLLFSVYFMSVWGIHKFEQAAPIESSLKTAIIRPDSHSADVKKAIGGYSLHALMVIVAAVFLPYFGKPVALYSGLGDSLFGTLFIAATTSLPELVVSFAAVRMGSLDIAVGNLLGSNVFNMFILGVDDVFYRQGSLFKALSPSHLFSVFVSIIMTALVVLGLLFRPRKKRFWHFGFSTYGIPILYLALIAYLLINK